MYDPQIIAQLINDNKAAATAFSVLSSMGGVVYLVGGAVRDVLLGKEPKDIDLMVTGLPIETIQQSLKNIGGRVTYTDENREESVGRAMGILVYSVDGDHVEIALPRTEVSTGPGHSDFDVQHHHNIPVEVDLGRRDFTANAMAINLNELDDPYMAFIDPYGGADSIANNELRLVNENAFQDDPLRILRAIVAYARHGLIPDEYTEESMKQNADKIRDLPGERIQMELDKLLSSDDPATALEIAHYSGVLDYVLPEVSNAMGFDQKNKYHDMELGDHLMSVLRNITPLTQDPDVRLAALLHDIGKPDSQWFDDEGNAHYYQSEEDPNSQNHEEVGAEMAEELMNRLHYSNNRIEKVKQLISIHMYPYWTTQTGARRFLNSLGGDYQTAQDFMKLREADAKGKKDQQLEPHDQENLFMSQNLLNHVMEKSQAVTVADLPVSGNDIINLGVPQGPRIGEILQGLLDLKLEHPDLTREELLERAKFLANE